MAPKSSFAKPRAPDPLSGFASCPAELLPVLNDIFQTDCQDPDAIDATTTWAVILAALDSYPLLASTLALRYQPGMTLSRAGRTLGISRERVHQRCQIALQKLRSPNWLPTIRNSIIGWPNLYRQPRAGIPPAGLGPSKSVDQPSSRNGPAPGPAYAHRVHLAMLMAVPAALDRQTVVAASDW